MFEQINFAIFVDNIKVFLNLNSLAITFLWHCPLALKITKMGDVCEWLWFAGLKATN